MKFEGKVIKYGDNVDTDVIIPARYLNTSDHSELAKHCMEDLDATFVTRVNKGDVMVAGYNFGCGSSREHAPIAIKASGISCVIAKTFARIFYRNAINIGLPIVESPECANDAEENDRLEIDLEKGFIINYNKGKTYRIEPFPEFIQKIIVAGGLMAWTKKEALPTETD
jgi:3-isopropylmalate/(R)-2-methylmalate dehydratase small subunit